VQPDSTIRKQASALMLVVGVMHLSACAAGNASTPTPTAIPTISQPSQAQETVWQPPEPSLYVESQAYAEANRTPTTSPYVPGVIIAVQAVGQFEYLMTITESGIANAYYDRSREVTYTLQLSPDRISALLLKFEKAQFVALPEIYPTPERSPSATVDVGDAHAAFYEVTYIREGQSKSVGTKYESAPDELRDIITDLDDLLREVTSVGTKQSLRPDLLITYYLSGSQQRVWLMYIDIEGGISFATGPPTARMTPHELSELKAQFIEADWYRLRSWYSGSPEQGALGKHRAIIGYHGGSKYKDVNILTGATISSELEELLRDLAEIYDKYAPREHIK
jgi:hypothetical protein